MNTPDLIKRLRAHLDGYAEGLPASTCVSLLGAGGDRTITDPPRPGHPNSHDVRSAIASAISQGHVEVIRPNDGSQEWLRATSPGGPDSARNGSTA